MDTDLDPMTREDLIAEVKKLRQGIRQHRDSSQHELCWHHPDLWGLLPEKTDPLPVVPEWPQFMQGCVRYRQSLDEQAPGAPRTAQAYQDGAKPEPAHRGSVVVTVFRSRLEAEHAAEYAQTAARMRTLAEAMPGFVSFKTFRADDGERLSLIEFESEETLAAWRDQPEHRQAQQRGRAAFYAEFQLQVCFVVRQYGFKRPEPAPSAAPGR